jgi:hypothetical protein
MEIYYFWFFLFSVAAYFVVTDESVAKLVHYATTILKNKYLIFQWWMIHNPKTPWARYSMHRRSMKLAKELMKDLELKSK